MVYPHPLAMHFPLRKVCIFPLIKEHFSSHKILQASTHHRGGEVRQKGTHQWAPIAFEAGLTNGLAGEVLPCAHQTTVSRVYDLIIVQLR